MTKKIIGIGNAIVDILCKVDEDFLLRTCLESFASDRRLFCADDEEKFSPDMQLSGKISPKSDVSKEPRDEVKAGSLPCEDSKQVLKHSLIKGSMSLIDETTAKKFSSLQAEKITSGGSVGNTIATLGQLGCKTSFIGKVGSDDFGSKFISEIEKTGTEFIGKKISDRTSAKSFVLVTPDASRTMCTFLGCASEISENDIDDKNFNDASLLYLEGYLWDRKETISGLQKAIGLAKKHGIKIAFSLSDSFCVSRHKKDFLSLVLNDLDILFANEREALELISHPDFSTEALSKTFSHNPNLTAIITRSEKGCAIFSGGNLFKIQTKMIDKPVDTTGAGDAFAAGFLYGLANDFDLEKSAHYGNLLAGRIIQKFGARFEMEEIKKFV